jgi:hypothetical protein
MAMPEKHFFAPKLLQVVPYLQDFPFPYYVVVQDLQHVEHVECGAQIKPNQPIKQSVSS